MADMAHPVLTSSQTPVFTLDNGRIYKFFVEATAVRGRPTLIRKIFKNGGSVVNSALEADILLAENNTKEALELFEAWRGDKILLSTRWVARCLEEHTLLGSEHGWAGYELTRDVLVKGIVCDDDASEAEEEEELQKPKRPRRTFPSSQTSKTSQSEQPLSELRPSRSRTSNTAPPGQSRKASSISEHTAGQRHSSPPLQSHNSISQPQADVSLPATPSLTVPMDTAIQTSFPSSHTALQQLQQQQALFSAMFSNLIQIPQQPLNPDLLSSLGQFTNFPQISPLIAPSLQQYFAQQLAVNPQALHTRHTEVVEQPGLGGTGHRLMGVGATSSSTLESSIRPTPEDVDPDMVSDASSVRSEEGEVEFSISHRRRAKGREMSDSSSNHEIQTAVRSNPSRPKAPAPRKKTGIFVDGQGNSLHFYVMVDLKNRQDLVKIVRKHNGTIVSQMNDADYIILNNRSNQFQKTLDLLPTHSIALSPSWLEECEKVGTLAKLGSHVIDVTSGVGRGVSRRKLIAPKGHPTRAECESEEDAPKSLGQRATPQRPFPTIGPQEGTNDARPRSPSPLAPTTIMAASRGKNLFTEEDRMWFFRYARFKLERNPHISHAALMRTIARKAPHHPVKSWENMARTKWLDDMKTLKQEIASLPGQTSMTLPSPPSSTPRNAQTELMYPESSPTPIPSQSSLALPSGSVSTWHNSQAEPSICTTPLKRKEQPSEGQSSSEVVDQYSKRLKTESDEVIDVDLYLDV